MPSFTSDWFTQNIGQWAEIFTGVRWNPEEPKVVVEIGSFEGRSTLWILRNMLKHPDSRIHCIDTFEGGPEYEQAQLGGLARRFAGNIRESGLEGKVFVHKTQSWRALHELLRRQVRADFVYVDGSHRACDVLEDTVLAFRLLKPQGVMICDDYLWPGQADVLNAPKLALDAFSNIYRRKMQVISHQRLYQLALVKLAD